MAGVGNELVADTPVNDLRDWAKGLYPLEAATELLIRDGFAQTWRPWVRRRDDHGWWIDFESVPDLIGGASGGERRFLLLAASLGAPGTVQVPLEDVVSGLDRARVDLILAAIAHAAGTHEGSRIVYDADGKPRGYEPVAESLHPWPEPTR